MFRSKKALWIALIVIVAAVGGGYCCYNNVYLRAQTPGVIPV